MEIYIEKVNAVWAIQVKPENAGEINGMEILRAKLKIRRGEKLRGTVSVQERNFAGDLDVRTANVGDGDWIVQTIEGNIYVMTDRVFKLKYQSSKTGD